MKIPVMFAVLVIAVTLLYSLHSIKSFSRAVVISGISLPRLSEEEIGRYFPVQKGEQSYSWELSSRCANCNKLSPPHTPFCWVPDNATIGDSLVAIRGLTDRTPHRMGQFVNVATTCGSGWCLDCTSNLIRAGRSQE